LPIATPILISIRMFRTSSNSSSPAASSPSAWWTLVKVRWRCRRSRFRSFDYEGKYLDAGTREICPAPIPEAMLEGAEDVALAAHTTLGCEGYSRTDMIAADDDHIYFLELNTLPGLTSSSLVPKELRAAGIGFREFLAGQIELARQRAHAVPSPR
jgi:hypothetical protein